MLVNVPKPTCLSLWWLAVSCTMSVPTCVGSKMVHVITGQANACTLTGHTTCQTLACPLWWMTIINWTMISKENKERHVLISARHLCPTKITTWNRIHQFKAVHLGPYNYVYPRHFGRWPVINCLPIFPRKYIQAFTESLTTFYILHKYLNRNSDKCIAKETGLRRNIQNIHTKIMQSAK